MNTQRRLVSREKTGGFRDQDGRFVTEQEGKQAIAEVLRMSEAERSTQLAQLKLEGKA